MNLDIEKSDVPEDTGQPESPSASPPADASANLPLENVQVSSPEFREVSDTGSGQGQATDLNRFQDIKVTVSADLGRANIPIQTLMNLGEGSVLELNREIDSPVELVAQGVPLACGEVVVVNGCFAVRVTKVYEEKKE